MRICLVSQEYPPETAHGGIASQTYLKARGLAERGHEVTVLSHSLDAREHERKDGTIRVLRIPADGRLGLDTEPARWLGYSLEVARALSRIHKETPLDLIDFPEWGCEGYAFFLNRTEWNTIPAVVHLQGPLAMFAHHLGWPELDSEFYRTGTAMEAACLRLADAVFSSSACSADLVSKHYGLDRKRIPVLHMGVDTELFQPCSVPKEERPTILFAGKIARNKGVEVLVKAACGLAREVPGLRLRLLGRGPAELVRELEGLARSAGRPDLLDFPGFVEREKLPEHLSRAHVFAAPSVFEGGPGFVYLEAMACGIPAIACGGSGAAEVVRDGVSGFLVPPENEAALSAALRKLLTDEAARKTLGRNARDYALEHADFRKQAGALEAFYTSVLAEKGAFPK